MMPSMIKSAVAVFLGIISCVALGSCDFIDVQAMMSTIDERADQLIRIMGNDSYRRTDEEYVVTLQRIATEYGQPKAIATLVTIRSLTDNRDNDSSSPDDKMDVFKKRFEDAVAKPCKNVRSRFTPHIKSLKRAFLLDLTHLIPDEILVQLKGLIHCKEIMETRDISIQEGFKAFEKYTKPLYF